ncbi:MAG: hypothetical protein Tsb0021_02840 [Chlamydiales bacterium]
MLFRRIQENLYFALMLLLTSSLELNSQEIYSNCSTCQCKPEEWKIYGDWLYWRVRECDLDYGIVAIDSVAMGKIRTVNPNYDSGFRLGAVKQCNNWNYNIDYTRYNTNASNQLNVSGIDNASIIALRSLLSNISIAQSSWKLCYDKIDLTTGYIFAKDCCYEANLFGGLTFAFIEKEVKSLYISPDEGAGQTSNMVKQKNDMNGYGMCLGISGNYNLYNCLHLIGLCSTDILVAQFDRRFFSSAVIDGEQAQTTLLADFYGNCWKLINVLNLLVGIQYDIPECYPNLTASLSLGYEFHHWWNVPGYLTQSSTGLDQYNENIGFDGLFLRGTIKF